MQYTYYKTIIVIGYITILLLIKKIERNQWNFKQVEA